MNKTRQKANTRLPPISRSHFIQRCKLKVGISGLRFAREFHYFVSLQVTNHSKKKRTEVSSKCATPLFKNSVFSFFFDRWDFELYSELALKVFIGRQAK